MKVNVNIKVWDDSSTAKLEEFGVTPKFLEILFKTAFETLLKDGMVDGCEYLVDVEVTE